MTKYAEYARDFLRDAFFAGLKAADPAAVVPPHLPDPPKGRLVVVGAGKAAAAMAAAVEAHYREVPLEGVVVTRYGHSLPTEQIEVVEAAHPVPDEAGVKAAERILELARSLSESDLLLCLISGGGSALLSAPVGVTLERKAQLTKALLRSGADIHEMNAVRKHLSAIKGGRLAAAAKPARVVSLLISDVTGDDPATIASGPTAPDPSTFVDALEVLERYELDFPDVRAYFERQQMNSGAETPKPRAPAFQRVENILVSCAQDVLEATASFFREHDVTPLILSESVTGEAREAGKFHAALARQVAQRGQPATRPCALISGGETTVTVRNKGKGGRNTELLLSLAVELAGLKGVYALAADTDGIDGSEDAAGAIIGPDTLQRVEGGKRAARRYLDGNDSYSFFKHTGELLITGPTRTNVNDLRIVLVL